MRIPKGVEIRKIGEKAVYVRGEKGIQKAKIEGVEIKEGEVKVERGKGRGFPVIKRMIEGVSEGFKGKLKIEGVGYKAKEGKGEIRLSIGYKDEKVVRSPAGVEMKVKGNGTIITGKSDIYEELRQSLSRIREVRPARKDRYKGKGIK